MKRLSELEKDRRSLQRQNKTAEDPLQQKYDAWIEAQRSDWSAKYKKSEIKKAYYQYCRQKARIESRHFSLNNQRKSTPDTRRYTLCINDIDKQNAANAELDPDAFYIQKEAQLMQDMEDMRNGRLVDVPYLKQARKQIETSLEAGIPVYLVGHLGSGKTQLATECAESYMFHHLLFEKLNEKMKDCPAEETASYFEQIYPRTVKEIRPEDCRPYFIAGSHNMTADDMFFEKTLKLAHASENHSEQEELNTLLDSFMSFLKENESRMQNMNPDQQLELMLAGWKTFSSLYIAENTGYGTVVEKIEKEVLKALREGRPVIIDEINTIAMANLIALNDILQHHAGQTAYIAGIGSVEIKDGFCLIGTGNLSTGTVSYEGTNTLNPAFQSRFTTIVYNYVPQNTAGDLNDQKDMEKNELFRLLITHLCNPDGSLSLPDPETTLNELWHLAEMARISQDIFEGKSTEKNESGDMPVLNEAVLSVRNLIHVLDYWNDGEEEDLSMALWNGFLSSVTNADDRNLLLALAVRYGFFPESKGWHVVAKAKGEGALSFDEIRTKPYEHILLPLETLSREDVVCLLYGRGPKRKNVPDALKEDVLIDDVETGNISSLMETDAAIRHLEHSAFILKQNDDQNE